MVPRQKQLFHADRQSIRWVSCAHRRSLPRPIHSAGQQLVTNREYSFEWQWYLRMSLNSHRSWSPRDEGDLLHYPASEWWVFFSSHDRCEVLTEHDEISRRTSFSQSVCLVANSSTLLHGHTSLRGLCSTSSNDDLVQGLRRRRRRRKEKDARVTVTSSEYSPVGVRVDSSLSLFAHSALHLCLSSFFSLSPCRSLTLQNVDDRMAGRYKCLAQNRLGSVENEFQLLIRGQSELLGFDSILSLTLVAQVRFIGGTFPSVTRRKSIRVSRWNVKGRVVNHYSINGRLRSSTDLQCYSIFSRRLKDEAFLSDRTSSDHRMRTYSDGVLTIDNIQPSDHGSYVCMISSIPNVTQIRSKPAVITVRCKWRTLCSIHHAEWDTTWTLDPPLPARDRPSQNLTFIRGTPGECPCLLDAYPPIESVSWYRNGKAIRIESKGKWWRFVFHLIDH